MALPVTGSKRGKTVAGRGGAERGRDGEKERERDGEKVKVKEWSSSEETSTVAAGDSQLKECKQGVHMRLLQLQEGTFAPNEPPALQERLIATHQH